MAERSLTVRLRAEVDQYRRDMDSAAKATSGVGDAAAGAGKQKAALSALGDAGKAVGRTLVGIGAAGAAGMAALAVATIKTGISYNTLEQTTRAALTTLLGGAEAAEAQMEKLREFVKTALFPREVFIEAQQQLLAFGFAAENVIPTLDALQNAVAATGGSAQTFREVTEILAQMQSTGKITAQELRELGRRGINAAELIGQAMGKTEGQIRESITAGALDGRDAIELLVTAMEDRFAGAAELVSNTWTGARGLVTAALRDIGSAVVETFIDPRGGGAAVVWARDVADVLRAVETQVRSLVSILSGSAEPAFQAVSDKLQGAAEAIEQFDIGPLIERLRDGAPALAAFGAGISAAGGASLASAVGFGSLASALNPLGAAISAAVLVSPELRDLLMELLEALAPLLPIVLDTGVALATALSTGLAAVADILTPLVSLVALIVDAFAALPGPVQQATLAVVAFSLALRFAGPVGAALTVLATLGAAIETLDSAFGTGAKAASEWDATLAETSDDLERLARTGRIVGDLSSLNDRFADLAERLGGAKDQLNFWEREVRSARDSLPDFISKSDAFAVTVIGLGGDLQTTSGVLEEYRQQLTTLDDALGQLVAGGEMEQASAAFAVIAAQAEQAGLTHEQLIALFPEYVRQLERYEEKTGDAAGAQAALAGEADAVTASLQDQADEIRKQTDPLFALTKALKDVQDKQAAYNDAVDKFGSDSIEAQSAAADLFDAVLDLQGAAGDASGAFDGKLTPAMRASLEAAGLTKDQIDAVEQAMRDAAEAGRDYEDTYEAQVELHGAEAARRRARALQDQLDRINRDINITFRLHQVGTPPSVGVARPQRWGGVVAAQHGMLVPAGIATSPTVLFGERATGEEAFIPRNGDPDRSRAILAEAASWYGLKLAEATKFAQPATSFRRAVLPTAGQDQLGGGGVKVANLNVQAWSDRFSLRQIEDELAFHGAI